MVDREKYLDFSMVDCKNIRINTGRCITRLSCFLLPLLLSFIDRFLDITFNGS